MAIVTMVAVGIGLFAGSNLTAMAGGTSANPDTCGYNPAAAPKPGGGTVIFDENSVTRAIAIYGVGSGAHIGVFANDESSLFVGTGGEAFKSGGAMTLSAGLTLNTTYTSISVNTPHAAITSGDSIVLKNASGTQTVKASASVASGVSTIPVVSFKAGKTFNSGDSATDTNSSLAYGSASPAALGTGTDAVGRFVAPSLYMTDITNGFSNAGDYEQGGTRISPFTADGLYGGWSNVIGSKPPVQNNWNLGPNGDTPPAKDALGGTTTAFNEGYGTEVVWNVSGLLVGGQPLQAGHTYRVQSITHDDDQNHTSGGGDVGEVCTTIGIPGINTTATGDQIHVDGTANVSDTATVGGVATPLPSGTSQVEFKVYGPDPTPGSNPSDDCSGTPQSKNVTLNSTTPNGAYPSGNFLVSAPGDYHFTADLRVGGNIVASSACGATGETATVTSRPTSLTTEAGGPYAPPTSLSDTATLSGGTTNAGGTLTFTLYADNGSGGCATPALGSVQVTVNNGANGAQYIGTINAPANPGYFVPGTYHWSVTYGGDPLTGNDASSDGVPCPATDTATNHENPVVLNPHIAISKTPDNQTIETGTTASFTITVTNDGTVALTNVNVTDPNSTDCVRTAAQTAPLIAAAGNLDSSFDPGEHFSYTCSSPTLTANLHNVATAHGTAGAKTVTADDAADVKVIHPSINVLKNPPTQSVPLGGTASFTLTVTNDGDTGLTNVVVNDPAVTGAGTNNCALTAAQTLPKIQAVGNHDSTFDVGETFTYNCTSGPVTAAFLNVAQSCGVDQLGTTVCDTSDDGGTPPPGCPEATRCGQVNIESLATTQDFKPKDNATLSGFSNTPNGDMTFALYKGSCTLAHLIYSDVVTISAGGTASTASSSYLSALNLAALGNADTAGTYNWQVSYGSDTHGNADVHGACGTENFVVTNG